MVKQKVDVDKVEKQIIKIVSLYLIAKIDKLIEEEFKNGKTKKQNR